MLFICLLVTFTTNTRTVECSNNTYRSTTSLPLFNFTDATSPPFTVNTSTTPTTTLATTAPPCLAPCECHVDSQGLVAMKCVLADLPQDWKLPSYVQSLILSNNGLTSVPSQFFQEQGIINLQSLSLGGNNITSLHQDVFNGLINLRRLDISFMNLQEWTGSINNTLPSLEFIDNTGNPWIPTANILLAKSLKKVKGVSWSSVCYNCTLVKLANMPRPSNGSGGVTPTPIGTVNVFPTESVSSFNVTIGGVTPPGMYPSGIGSPSIGSGPPGMEEGPPGTGGGPPGSVGGPPGMGDGPPGTGELIGIGVAFEFHKLGYFPFCSDIFACSPEYLMPPKASTPIISLPSRLFYVAYILGALAIAFNACIIFIYVYSYNMRKVNSMLLISNMAVCDILVGVYCIIIGKINIFNVLLHTARNPSTPFMFTRLCPVASVIFTLGQVVSVFTGLLLTIDKYLSIVYCMDPSRKLSRRLSLVVLALCWVATLLYGISPKFESKPDLVWSPVLLCTLPVTEEKGIVICFGLLILLYLANIPFYGKIFMFVRSSSARMGVRRDAILAKKIALLIFTNFVFFVIPMTILIVFIFLHGIHYEVHFGDVKDPVATQRKYIISYWLPVTFLGINSCLNPFLCAFRQRQFRREVRRCARSCLLNHMCKAFSTIRSDSSLRTAPATRVEMYKLSKIDSQAN
ncbi:uncharacterized protein LOC5515295 isoform X2 [Nematostella vectensis]|nr:uncharacterized protein LOC5515295 isoform X2 [Nematostella vectensis]XP_032240864.2 uncharacterized protein LOC5515295 isoform X2 [Nematostella vectensis]